MKEIKSDFVRKLAEDETPAPEVGEIMAEYRRVHEKMINDIISKHQTYAPVYFISVMNQKDPVNVNFVRRRYIVRKSCPEPEYDQEIYSYDNRSGKLQLEWCLPPRMAVKNILRHSDSHDPMLVSWINKYRDGELKAPAYS